MTNWCYNLLEAEGSPEAVAAFRKLCFGKDGLVHFECVLPVPAEVAALNDYQGGKMGRDGELGVAAILKSESALLFPNISPILNRPAVKEAGIRSFEDLEQWLRKNNPNALELGAKAVNAYSKTGSCFADDWMTTNGSVPVSSCGVMQGLEEVLGS